MIEALHGLQHDLQDVILKPSQNHQGQWCLESPCCRGPAERLGEATDRLRDFDGVRRGRSWCSRMGRTDRRAPPSALRHSRSVSAQSQSWHFQPVTNAVAEGM